MSSGGRNIELGSGTNFLGSGSILGGSFFWTSLGASVLISVILDGSFLISLIFGGSFLISFILAGSFRIWVTLRVSALISAILGGSVILDFSILGSFTGEENKSGSSTSFFLNWVGALFFEFEARIRSLK